MYEYLANILDAANEGIYVTDRDRKFLFWNKAAEQISGYSRDEMLGKYCYDKILSHVDSENNELCLNGCPLSASIADGVSRGPALVYLKHKTGERVAVEVRTAPFRNNEGEIIGGVEVFQDVTKRLERDRLLRERKEELETVLNSINEGILFLDTEGNLSVINRACAEMFALDDGAKGVPIHALPPDMPVRQALSSVETAYRGSVFMAADGDEARCPEGLGRFRCWTAAIDRTPRALRSRCYECLIYRKMRTFLEKPQEYDREDRSFSVVSSFLEFPETNDLWEVIVFHDVTSEKLDAALKVAGAAAHELRQPMQAVVILAGMLDEELRGNAPLRKNVKMLLKSCARMDHIIQRMSEITRYRTVDYLGGRRILDLANSSDTVKPPVDIDSFDSAML